jgi:hypothetical protein
MNRVMINGNVVGGSIAGRNISIIGNKILVDGVDVTPDAKIINIEIQGDVETIKVDACDNISVSGNAESVRTVSGDIDIKGNVTGGVSTVSGDVKCGNVGGSCTTVSGDIK